MLNKHFRRLDHANVRGVTTKVLERLRPGLSGDIENGLCRDTDLDADVSLEHRNFNVIFFC